MRYFIGFVLVLLILFLLLRLDYNLGRKSHLKRVNMQEYPARKSDLRLFTSGEQLFSNYFSEIQQAESHIHIQFYILQDDDFSKKFVTLLTEKAEEGLEVRLLLDWVGSKNVTKEMEKNLRDAGVSLAYSNKPSFPYFFYKLNARNHRKVTVVDGKTGYIGGFNVGKEYLGKDEEMGLWRDYHLKITGEGVVDLQTQFMNDWFEATDEVVTSQETYYPALHQGKSEIKFASTNGVYLEDALVSILERAKEEIIIGTPYFIPGDKVKSTLIEAARRGVKIRVLVPQKADHPLVKEASLPFLEELTKEGIQFFTFTKGFFHAKTILVDDFLCDIGTTNFDKRSLYSNYEINCYIYDKEFIQYVRNQIEQDFAASNKLTIEDIKEQLSAHKIKVRIASLLQFFL